MISFISQQRGGDSSVADRETTQLRRAGILQPDESVYEYDSALDSIPIPGLPDISTVKGAKSRFVIQRKGTRSFRQSREAEEQSFYVKFEADNDEDPANLADLGVQLQVMFETLIQEVTREYGPHGWCRVFMQHEQKDFECVIAPTKINEMSAENIMHHVGRVARSAGRVPVDDNLIISLGCVKSLSGRGRRKITNFHEDIRTKRSVVQIQNTDNLCMTRAICVGMAHLNWQKKKGTLEEREALRRYDLVKRSKNSAQKRVALELLKEMDLSPEEEGDLQQIPLYENHLKTGITVISTESLLTPVYNGRTDFGENERIFLVHSKTPEGYNHFDTITKITGFMAKQNYCNRCEKGYDKRGSHRCEKVCSVCGSVECEAGDFISCETCNRVCRSRNCLNRHKFGYIGKSGKMLKPLCQQKWFCPQCKTTLQANPSSVTVMNHVCGETFCSNCGENYLNNHFCYMQQEQFKESGRKFIFFDFESTQENDIHHPILVVAQTSCNFCKDFTVEELPLCSFCGARCPSCSSQDVKTGEFLRQPCLENETRLGYVCSQRRSIFYGEDCNRQFCRWLLQGQNRNSKIFAHNARGYDAYFILDYLKEQGLKPDKIIMTGSKIMQMKFGGPHRLELLDSLNFLPMALAKLPKSFGLFERKKGFFPHLFNTQENQNIVLSGLPDCKFYGLDDMNPMKRAEFLNWYAENKDKEFNFKKEMLDYCISDVSILQEACMKFQKIVAEVTSEHSVKPLDPFCYTTIASTCLGIFKYNFLPVYFDILTRSNASPSCTHGYDCTCLWEKGRQLSASSDLEIYDSTQDTWNPTEKTEHCIVRFSHTPVGIVPPNEYGIKGNHSKEGIQWIEYFQHSWNEENPSEQIEILHARNGGERMVLCNTDKGVTRYHLDGFFERRNGEKHALEFYECNWHGCPRCFSNNRDKQVVFNKTLNQLFSETMIRERRLKNLGFELHTMWGCQFKTIPNIEEVMKTSYVVDPLRLRECYFWRTGQMQSYCTKKWKETKRHSTWTFTSLYPSVLKYDQFPVGHPKKQFNPSWNLLTESCPAKKRRDM